jgi:succinate-semialdehyde dehydrogenase/glutarate-semialdehyde dehydrogenase
MAIETQRPMITVRSPASGEVLGEAPITPPDEVMAAMERARTAQRDWGNLSVRERCRQLQTFRKALAAQADDLAMHLVRENGKPRQEALIQEVVVLLDLLWYYGRRAPEVLRPKALSLHLLKHRRSYLHYRPKGVVGIIAPWNFPLLLPFADAAFALMAGNAAIIKPSEITPLIALKAKAIWDSCGLPRDLLQVLPGGPDTGKALIEARPNHVIFTGSVASGRKVAVACAERLITYSLELGGKNAAVVCSDADIDRTARALVWGAFANSGQICASVERVYAVKPICEPLVARVVELTSELRQGNPAHQEVDVGSMTFPRQIDVVADLVEDAVSRGATVAIGGKRAGEQGLYYAPTVLTGVKPDMRIMREESFGPVLPIMAVDSEADAIRLANDSALGLGGYVFSKDVAHAMRLAEHVEAGSVMVNDVITHAGTAETPWGGVKESGVGRVRSDLGLLELVDVHHVNYPRVPMPREIWWYPYRESLYQLVLATVKRLFG